MSAARRAHIVVLLEYLRKYQSFGLLTVCFKGLYISYYFKGSVSKDDNNHRGRHTEVAYQPAKEDQPSRNDECQHDIQMKDHSKLKQRRSTHQILELTDFRLDT